MMKKILPFVVLCLTCLSSCTNDNNQEKPLNQLYSWMQNMQKENIRSIYLDTTLGSIAPTFNAFNETYVASLEEIEQVCHYFQEATYKKTDQPIEPGRGASTYRIHFKNDSVHYFSHTNYRFYESNYYYDILDKNAPRFMTHYGYSFLYQTVISLNTMKNGEEIDFDASFFSSILFNSTDTTLPQQEKYKGYTWTLSNLEENQLAIVDDHHFSIQNEKHITHYEVLNSDFTFASYF